MSFYTTGGYYETKANELRAQCDSFGVAHDIVPINMHPGEDWADICRRKVAFYREMLHKHKSTIMWLDVDSVLLRSPVELSDGAFDMALFARSFKYLPQYNPGGLARSFHPGYLVFRYTPDTIQFLEDCREIDRTHEGPFTDDYILEEAFRTSEAKLRLLMLSPRDIARPGDADTSRAMFRHGDSGNVNEFKGKVKQHTPRGLAPDQKKKVVTEMIQDFAQSGNRAMVAAMYRYLIRINPSDFPSLVKLLDLLHRSGDAKALRAQLDAARKVPDLRPYALRFEMLRALEAGDWAGADALFKLVEDTGHQTMINFCRSRLFRYDLDRRAEKLNIPDDKRAKIFWWEEPYPGNLGDIINPYVVEGLTGIPPKYAPRGTGIYPIGSIIKFAKAGCQVWGAGSPHEDDQLDPAADYRSVRGPYTRDLVLRCGGQCDEVYGDAAWFLPVIFRPTVPKTHKTGLILHYQHENADLDVSDDIRRIDIRRLGYDQIEAFLTEMLSCERIVSTSLHGVIIAQAYGLPAMLATVTDSSRQVHGDGIKFKDYFASVGIHDPKPAFDLSGLDKISDSTLPEENFVPIGHRINLTRLIEVAPFDVLPEIKRAAEAFDGAD
ncbi:polysaccharide pyruvyl transferase family protein [Thalassorhabdomicrobium marinisediminis]|uniref:polysaccharide pyruvyl transferase family protein n=1 Tax=Thalassorhabdomicrobium marinisediminis TaxID=2170577 RepID=UPI00249318E3|nr:polysaccharide pyruvyl transferase family protein [Thalassorhabdomicrobium marinisediminis]